MSSYNTFAFFYDDLTQNVDYEVRSDYISDFFCRLGVESGKILDLACGTGSVSMCLHNKGYDVTGIDLSSDMLTIADSKSNGKIKLIQGDMTDFCTNECYDGCVCSLDSINHLVSIEDVKKCFNCVKNALKPNGVFVFDVNTIYKHNHILGDNSFVFDEEDYFLSWDNENVGDNSVRILLDFFVFNGTSYDRYSEEFYEKAYSIDEIVSALDGFEIIDIFDDLTFDKPKDDSERLYFVCKRKDN